MLLLYLNCSNTGAGASEFRHEMDSWVTWKPNFNMNKMSFGQCLDRVNGLQEMVHVAESCE